MFSSKTPRDLNHDPRPYVTYANDRRTDVRSAEWDMQSDGGVEYVRSFDPRPEFDHVQHNEPNPILVAFRDSKALRGEGATGKARWWLAFGPPPSVAGTDSEWSHARRVLTRLANLSQIGA